MYFLSEHPPSTTTRLIPRRIFLENGTGNLVISWDKYCLWHHFLYEISIREEDVCVMRGHHVTPSAEVGKLSAHCQKFSWKKNANWPPSNKALELNERTAWKTTEPTSACFFPTDPLNAIQTRLSLQNAYKHFLTPTHSNTYLHLLSLTKKLKTNIGATDAEPHWIIVYKTNLLICGKSSSLPHPYSTLA